MNNNPLLPFPPSRDHIDEYLKGKISDSADIFEQSDLLQQSVFDLWSSVIKDLADDSPVELSLTPSSSITGVSVNVTGDAISRGRWVKTNISRNSFDRFLRTYLNIEPGMKWTLFAGALLHTYWRVYGRDVAIAHHFLHETAGTSETLHMVFKAGYDPEKENEICFGNVIDKFAFQAPEDRRRAVEFFQELYRLVQEKGSEAQLTMEDYVEIAEEAFVRAGNNCFVHTLQKANIELLVALNSDAALSEKIEKLLVQATNNPEDPHEKHAKLERTIKGLQLLMLYREMAGDHFYILTPAKGVHLQYVFTTWSEDEIPNATLRKIMQFATNLSSVANKLLWQKTMEKRDEKAILRNLLDAPLADDFSSQFEDSKLYSSLPKQGGTKLAGIPGYLVMAEKLVQNAIHEGQKLQFRIHISGGDAASKRIQYVSALPRIWEDGSYLKWTVDPSYVESFGDKGLSYPSLISLLVGNFSFFQDDRHVLQVSPWGHVQYLGRVIGSIEAEDLTCDGDNVLISIEPHADIKVYFRSDADKRGTLKLWRRGGKWIMPKLYGEDYRNALAQGIGKQLGIVYDDGKMALVKILCKCVWELSTREHKGACFVVLNRFSEQGRNGWQQYFSPMTKVLPFAEKRRLLTKAGKATLKQLAVQDGATVVDLEACQISGRRHILVNYDVLSWLEKKLQKSEVTKTWWEAGGVHRLLRWGTRHHSALATALFLNSIDPKSKKAAVVTVSSDGDIHLLGPEGPILECSYPHAVST